MIIFDLEWNRGYDKTPLEEILQIGAVRVDEIGGKIVDTFCMFVHPCVHRRLNRTAKTLPELQAAFDSPYDFPTALDAFRDWCGGDTVFADWGGDDFEVLRQNCAFWLISPPEATQLIDLQAAFSLRVGTNQGVALYRAAEYCGIPDVFTFHNALNDAVYTALVSQWINADALALLALPKEIRRLNNCPPFTPPPAKESGPYGSVQAALNGRGCRRAACPICGESAWVRRWYTAAPDDYFGDFRCKDHGSFLCRLRLLPTENGPLMGQQTIPPVTSALLQEFEKAIRNGAVTCKSGSKHSRHWKKRRHSTPKKAETR